MILAFSVANVAPFFQGCKEKVEICIIIFIPTRFPMPSAVVFEPVEI